MTLNCGFRGLVTAALFAVLLQLSCSSRVPDQMAEAALTSAVWIHLTSEWVLGTEEYPTQASGRFVRLREDGKFAIVSCIFIRRDDDGTVFWSQGETREIFLGLWKPARGSLTAKFVRVTPGWGGAEKPFSIVHTVAGRVEPDRFVLDGVPFERATKGPDVAFVDKLLGKMRDSYAEEMHSVGL